MARTVQRKRGCTIEVEQSAREDLLRIIEMDTGSRTGLSMKQAMSLLIRRQLELRNLVEQSAGGKLLIVGGHIPEQLRSAPTLLTFDLRLG